MALETVFENARLRLRGQHHCSGQQRGRDSITNRHVQPLSPAGLNARCEASD